MFTRARGEVRAVLERDPAARRAIEVVLLYPGVHAVWNHRFAHWLWGKGLRFLPRAVSQLSRWATGIEIHPGAQIGQRFFIDHGAGVVIGETSIIGDDVTMYHGVTLGGTSLEKVKRHPTIGDRVVIGAGAKVLGDITVGSDSRIGANAVLVRSVSPQSIVVGVPGQVINATTGPSKTDVDPVAQTLKSLIERVDALESAGGHGHQLQPLYLNAAGDWEQIDFVI